MKSKPEKRQNQEKEENKTLDTAGGRARKRGKKGRLFQTAYLGCDGYRIR